MKSLKIKFLAAFLVLCTTISKSQTIDYFGQTPPGDSVEKFAPGIISLDDRLENKIVFSSDGSECYFQVYNLPDFEPQMLFSVYVDNSWTNPEEVPFTIDQPMVSPFITSDGNKIYFSSTETNNNGYDIYCTERTAAGWSDPIVMPEPINSTVIDLSYIETDSAIYLSSKRTGGIGSDFDIWKITKDANQTLQAVNMGEPINSVNSEVDPCVAPDGSYIIFASDRNSSQGWAHLYISFKDTDGNWTEPINMNSAGVTINVENAFNSDAVISPDGEYIFFKRHGPMEVMDIYWVSTSIIDDLRKIAPISIKEKSDLQINIYPNPANQYIKIEGLSHKEATFKIMDIAGKQITQGKLTSNTIHTASLAKGIYILQLVVDNEQLSKKFVLE